MGSRNPSLGLSEDQLLYVLYIDWSIIFHFNVEKLCADCKAGLVEPNCVGIAYRIVTVVFMRIICDQCGASSLYLSRRVFRFHAMKAENETFRCEFELNKPSTKVAISFSIVINYN